MGVKNSMLLACCLLLTACSNTFLYNRLDWLIGWYVDDYVDMSYSQKTLFNQSLKPYLHWHRTEELTNYISLLEQIKRDVSSEVSSEQVLDWVEQVRVAERKLKQQFLSLALEFSDNLSNQQMAEFSDSLWQRQNELEQEYLSRDDDEYATDSYERLSKYLAYFTGKLESSQLDSLRQAAWQLQRLDYAWLEDRKRWLETITPLLKREANWQESIKVAFKRRESLRTVSYRSTVEHNLLLVNQAVAQVMNQLNKKQRSRFNREMDELIDDLRSLKNKAKPTYQEQPLISL